jgi:hypothetical protein
MWNYNPFNYNRTRDITIGDDIHFNEQWSALVRAGLRHNSLLLAALAGM